jgi:diguanylate cyclase (GGDEF)-like protein/PAS domain S-box-containing protein
MFYSGNTRNDPSGSDLRFRLLSDSSIIGIFEGNANGEFVNGNAAFLRMLGYTQEDLDAKMIRWDRMAAPGYKSVQQSLAAQLATSGAAAPAELEYIRSDGSRLPVLVGLASLGAGPECGAIGFMLDLTFKKQAEEALRKSEEQFRELTENIREVFWMMDAAATEVLYVSPAYEQIWGQTCQSVYADPESWMHSIYSEDRTRAAEMFGRQVLGETIENEYRIVQPSGDIRWIRDRAFPVRDKDGKIVRLAGVAEDITDRKLSELRLIHQSFHDELTNLPNRRFFRDKLQSALTELHPGELGAVFFIDLDQFKLVNDTLGHSAGDELLKNVVCRLRAVCGDSGTLARFGGDEFTFLGTNFDGTDHVRRLGEAMIACLEQPFHIAGREVFVGASVGVSLFPEHGTDPFVLKKAADSAMHEAKLSGKNQLRFFSPAFTHAASERLEMETRLRRAVVQSEFRLQFQPQFAPNGSRPNRFEALIRWYPPDGDPVPPLKFIPTAEGNGLIVPIGTWVLREACRQCAAWQTGILDGVGVAVNVSAPQFACPDFVEVVMNALELTGLPPHLLELELTESVFIRDLAASAGILTRLRDLGVTIALDDFGTGYSSLSYLQNLPLDALKIDRSFIADAETRRQGAAVLRCVVDLAHAHGLRVVGEGVETDAQLGLLDSLGCDEIQGFLLGRPSFDLAVTGHKHAGNPSCPPPACPPTDATVPERLEFLSGRMRHRPSKIDPLSLPQEAALPEQSGPRPRATTRLTA